MENEILSNRKNLLLGLKDKKIRFVLIFSIILGSFLIFGLAVKVEAAVTLYVNSDSSGAANNPTRAFNDPSYTANDSYQTLTAAYTAASAGDTIEFSGGTSGKSYAGMSIATAKALTLQGSQISGHDGTVTITFNGVRLTTIENGASGTVLKRLTIAGGSSGYSLKTTANMTGSNLIITGGTNSMAILTTAGTSVFTDVFVQGCDAKVAVDNSASNLTLNYSKIIGGQYSVYTTSGGTTTLNNTVVNNLFLYPTYVDTGSTLNMYNSAIFTSRWYPLFLAATGYVNTHYSFIQSEFLYPDYFSNRAANWTSDNDTLNNPPSINGFGRGMGYITLTYDAWGSVTTYWLNKANYAMNTYGVPTSIDQPITMSIASVDKTTLQTLYKSGHQIASHGRHNWQNEDDNNILQVNPGAGAVNFAVSSSGTILNVTGQSQINLTQSPNNTFGGLRTTMQGWGYGVSLPITMGTEGSSTILKDGTTNLPANTTTSIPADISRYATEEVLNSATDLESALHEDSGCASYVCTSFSWPGDFATNTILTWISSNMGHLKALRWNSGYWGNLDYKGPSDLANQYIYAASMMFGVENLKGLDGQYNNLTTAQQQARIQQGARNAVTWAAQGYWINFLFHYNSMTDTEFQWMLDEIMKDIKTYNVQIKTFDGVINDILTSGNWTASSTPGYYTRTFTGTDDYTLIASSSLIDVGTSSVALTTDYLGNPIYGLPDIGGYEYQPPHTMGTDKIDIGAGARIYSDGKFRDATTTSGSLANLLITPSSGSFTVYGSSSTPRNAYLDVSVSTWSSTEKTWTESNASSGISNTLHTIGDLTPNNYYKVVIDGIDATTQITGANCGLLNSREVCQANSSGQVIFTYTGSYSTHTFDISQTSGPAVASAGGGMPSAWYNPPQTPVGGFSVLINNGNQTTTNSNVTLNLKGGPDTARMAISNTADFAGVSQEAYSQTKTWNLCVGLTSCISGAHTVYAKFFAPWGTASNVVSDSIILGNQTSSGQIPSTSSGQANQSFTKDLKFGNINADVKRLQIFLNQDLDVQVAQSGIGSSGKETNVFGVLTKAAVIKFQEKYPEEILTPWGITKGTGFVGKTTRAKINQLMGF